MAAAFDEGESATQYRQIAVQAGITGDVAQRFITDRSAADNTARQKELLKAYQEQASPKQQPCPIATLNAFETRLGLALFAAVIHPPQCNTAARTYEPVPHGCCPAGRGGCLLQCSAPLPHL